MKKLLSFGFAFMVCVGLLAQTAPNKKSTDKYADRWQQVEKIWKESDLPKSAGTIVGGILKEAIAEKNTPQTIKALIWQNKLTTAADRNVDAEIINDLSGLLQTSAKPTDKALLHSMIGELYLNYYTANQWQIRNRTNLEDFVPDDIKEWSANIFFNKVREHLARSVEQESLLLNASAKEYEDIIILGADSRTLSPTLYDFLMKRAIEQSSQILIVGFNDALKAENITLEGLAVPARQFAEIKFSSEGSLSPLFYYSKYLKSLQKRGLNESAVFTEISLINYLAGKSYKYKTEYAKERLLALEKENQAYDYNVEVINAIVSIIDPERYLSERSEEYSTKRKEMYNWAEYGIEKYPNYKRINLLKNQLTLMAHPYAQIMGSATFRPDNKNKRISFRYRNLNKATIEIKEKNTGKVAETITMNLTSPNVFEAQDTSFVLTVSEVGSYTATVKYDKNTTNTDSIFEFGITKLAHFARCLSDTGYEFYVVDSKDGTPVRDATVTVYSLLKRDDYKEEGTVKTNNEGFAQYTLPTKESYRYFYSVSLKNDSLTGKTQMPRFYSYRTDNKNDEDITILTDRNIYRPGQTVYFKVIAVQQGKPRTAKLITKESYKVTFSNPNGQVIAEKELLTNEFGSFAGEFVLPQGGLTGSYRIKIGDASEYIQVEEYKRPTFQVTFDKLKETYTFGDEVTLTGHAESYSGVKLQGANVSYTINKSSFLRWYQTGSTFVESGDVTTANDGSFKITFTIPQNKENPSDIIPLKRANVYNFTVDAAITDVNGETQSGNYSFAVGDVSMALSVEIDERLNKNSKDSLKVTAVNLNGEPVSVNGIYNIYSLQKNDSIASEVKTGNFSTNGVMDLMGVFRNLPSAKYRIVLKTNDEKGRDVEAINDFVLYSYNDKKPPIETNNWIIEKNNVFRKAKDVEIIIGVSGKTTVLFDLMKGSEVLERQQFILNNENRKLTIPYKDKYEDVVSAVFTYVVEGREYVNKCDLYKVEDNSKGLDLKLEVFRDKLRPGAHEEWRISVKDKKGQPAFAELLASMYDSSLDKIHKTKDWHFYPFPFSWDSPSLFQRENQRMTYLYSYFGYQTLEYPAFIFDRLNWFDLSLGMGYNTRYRMAAAAPMSPMNDMADALESKIDGLQTEATGEIVVKGYGSAPKKQSGASPQIRSNFNETAFFYPQLRTNEQGETIISFTVPESNTTWKFRALAYDKSLNKGSLEAMVVSRKELMVTPNMPRFVRQGDRTSISTKISNLSDNAVSGEVRIEFFDPLTDKILDFAIDGQKQTFSLGKDASSSATWTFTVPADIDLLGCRIVAESPSFSDGEQHVLSVLPNRMLVTESMTINANKAGVKEFTFDRFAGNKSASLSNYRLTLEYADNPAWYAVQTLPVLSNPANENAVNWLASYYVNTLGMHIMKQYPKVNAMIDAWKKQAGSKETLISKLQKNEELKAVLLEETPWVLDAKTETEQMNRLSLLFDMNNSRMQTEAATTKLLDLQRNDGGWSWYKGMYSSRSVTQYILYGYTQLVRLNAVQYGDQIKQAQMNALNFLDKEIVKDYTELKKTKDWEKATNISTSQLEYMFVRSAYRDIPIDKDAREAERFYTSVVEKNWTKLNLYERSLMIVLALRNGNKELADKIMKSVREYATVNDEMGMFWTNNQSSAFMSQSAVTTHTFMMEAFKEMKAPAQEMDLLKQWLLKQKQTQAWESTHATIDAIYALLSNGSDWFSSDAGTKVFVGGKEIAPENKELGTGYFKEAWTGQDINANMAKIRIEKPDGGPEWGAMYWQYYEDLDKISAQKGDLNVDKKLFVEQVTAGGKTLVQITESNPIKVGDKVVVRLTVRADRDLDFVQLKDMRASCFEPIETLSGVRWQNASIYYQATKDASTNFYFDHLPKGTYVFEYPVYANRTGEYSNGITTIQCMYAPEFVSHTAGIKVTVR
ncbi:MULTISPECIES: alpha-2-macroglobulin [unclassified Dysgonomonas]|uniref:alpha-2-macroglobulin family protein n=1 Tax=unclassified Dysgonomonas TaxID=2630389 RepID=UPI002475F8F6|nr:MULTISPECIES: MG2 domain-containing protein [unclassified Dysgonomonas]